MVFGVRSPTLVAPSQPLDLQPGAPMVEGRGLVKRFGSFTAVAGIDIRIEQGESFGFLGPNGAGKTSTMKMISCMSPVTEGSLRVLGGDPATQGAAIRARLGLVPQEDNLELELSVLDNIYIYGRYFDLRRREILERADRLLEFAQLGDRRNDKADTLSGGLKRRLTIARALISEPDLLILDEPTTGLDPQARHLLWERLYRLKAEGVTLIITTHYMDEAEQLCDRLVVMDGGDIVAQGTPRSLIDQYSTKEVLELRFGLDGHAPLSTRLDEARRASRGPARSTAPLRRRRRSRPRRRARARARSRERPRPPFDPGGRLLVPDRAQPGGLRWR